MKMKKIVSAFLAMAIMVMGCISVSAKAVVEHGISSGGTKGTTNLRACITSDVHTNAAFYAEVKIKNPKYTDGFGITSIATLTGFYGESYEPVNYKLDISKNFKILSDSPNADYNISVSGTAELPANNYYGYRYKDLKLCTDYTSKYYGTWSNIAFLEYPDWVIPGPSPDPKPDPKPDPDPDPPQPPQPPYK